MVSLFFIGWITKLVCGFSVNNRLLSLSLYELGTPGSEMSFGIGREVMRKGEAARSDKVVLLMGQSDVSDDITVDEGCSVSGITLKIAMDRAGAVGMKSKEDFGRFTSEESLDMVHRLRKDCQAVLVGRVTVERDDCTLTVRRKVTLRDGQEQPSRIVLDPNLTLFSPHQKPYKILTQPDALTYIYHSKTFAESQSTFDKWRSTQNITVAQSSHVNLVSLQNDDTVVDRSKLDSSKIWNHITSELKMSHILVEGGPTTAKAFLPIVDRIILVQANNVEFVTDPIPLGLSVDDLSSTHQYVGNVTTNNDEDIWFFFSKDGLWPTSALQQWP